MIAIFYLESEAITLSDKIHKFLVKNRNGYNAKKWSDVNKGELNEWYVKIPYDYTKFVESLDLGDSPKTQELPETGGEVLIDEYYLYKGDIIKCRQTHNRTVYEPKNTPALFSFFIDNSEQLKWLENEQVEAGWIRIYNDIKYEVIQAHQTQLDWQPYIAVTLWKVYIDPLLINEWTTGIAYKVDDIVIYNGDEYKCLQAHTSIATWTPLIASLWLKTLI